MRQIILDTETTGLRVEDGHRIIEIGCIEMINRRLTSRHFHYYINPEREIEEGAKMVHGITNESLQDKPLFKEIVDALMEFVDGAELIIHNAPFDLSFLDNELQRVNKQWKKITDHCDVIDTLKIARQLHPGQRNSLDALCKRYGIDNSKRELHGALLDADLLARVYLVMTGGQGSFFDDAQGSAERKESHIGRDAVTPLEKHQLTVVKADASETEAHEKYLEKIKKKGKCIWGDI